jgi:hypothetical protein
MIHVVFKQQKLKDHGYTGWQVLPDGVMICPDGNEIANTRNDRHEDCGCMSPLVEISGQGALR